MLSPIGAFLALAEPGASCLLESVEHGGKLSRYSFVGLDYLAAHAFDATADMLERVRACVEEYRPASDASGLGGALVVFAYDAARPFAHLAERAADTPSSPAAYVAVPGTWLAEAGRLPGRASP